MERKLVSLHSRSVAILLAAQQVQKSANILYKSLSDKEDIITPVICVAKTIIVMAETEAPVMVTKPRNDLVAIERPRNRKT